LNDALADGKFELIINGRTGGYFTPFEVLSWDLSNLTGRLDRHMSGDSDGLIRFVDELLNGLE
jgi:hypothetical protein